MQNSERKPARGGWVSSQWPSSCTAALFDGHPTTQSVSTGTGASWSSPSTLGGCMTRRTDRALRWSFLWQPTRSSVGTWLQRLLPQSYEHWDWWWFHSRTWRRVQKLLPLPGYREELSELAGQFRCRRWNRGVVWGRTLVGAETTVKMPWNQKLCTNWSLKACTIYHDV